MSFSRTPLSLPAFITSQDRKAAKRLADRVAEAENLWTEAGRIHADARGRSTAELARHGTAEATAAEVEALEAEQAVRAELAELAGAAAEAERRKNAQDRADAERGLEDARKVAAEKLTEMGYVFDPAYHADPGYVAINPALLVEKSAVVQAAKARLEDLRPSSSAEDFRRENAAAVEQNRARLSAIRSRVLATV